MINAFVLHIGKGQGGQYPVEPEQEIHVCDTRLARLVA